VEKPVSKPRGDLPLACYRPKADRPGLLVMDQIVHGFVEQECLNEDRSSARQEEAPC
jgi:hypothetical protein